MSTQKVSVPLLWPSVVTPKNEIEAIKYLHAHLCGLEYSVAAWKAALELYKLATNPPLEIEKSVASRWRFIACNECILELYHLRARLEKIRSVRLRDCPSLRPLVDIQQAKSAAKGLDEYFPGIEPLRHATAHQGENEAHSEKHAPDGRYALRGFREKDRFSAPHEGTIYSIDLTDESLDKIAEVVAEFLIAFQNAASTLEQQGHLD
jgi:hypothetical protein